MDPSKEDKGEMATGAPVFNMAAGDAGGDGGMLASGATIGGLDSRFVKLPKPLSDDKAALFF